jgi:hypothetical protein
MTRSKSTDVTYEDIVLWKKRIKQAKDAESPEDLVKVVSLMANDMCFLVALIESMLKIDVDQEVYDRARAMQRGDDK